MKYWCAVNGVLPVIFIGDEYRSGSSYQPWKWRCHQALRRRYCVVIYLVQNRHKNFKTQMARGCTIYNVNCKLHLNQARGKLGEVDSENNYGYGIDLPLLFKIAEHLVG